MQIRRTLLFIFPFLNACLVLFASFRHGLMWGSDGEAYLSCAYSLLSGEGFSTYHGTGEYRFFPPLYPLLLALFSFVFPPELAPAILHAFAAGVAAFFWLRLFQEQDKRVLFLLGFVWLSAHPLFQTHSKLASESVFMALLMACFRVFKSEGKQRTLWLGLLVSLLSLQRYVGGLLFFMVFLSLKNRQERLRFSLIFFLPVSLWVGRNLMVYQSLTGGHFQYLPEGSLRILLQPLSWIGAALFPVSGLSWQAHLWLGVGFLVFVLMHYLLCSSRPTAEWKRLILRFGAVYLLVVLFIIRNPNYQGGFERIFIPVFPVLLFVFFELIQSYQKSFIRVALLCFTLCWITVNAYHTVTHAYRRHAFDEGTHNIHSPLTHWLRSPPDSLKAYYWSSDAPAYLMRFLPYEQKRRLMHEGNPRATKAAVKVFLRSEPDLEAILLWQSEEGSVLFVPR